MIAQGNRLDTENAHNSDYKPLECEGHWCLPSVMVNCGVPRKRSAVRNFCGNGNGASASEQGEAGLFYV